MIISEVIYSFDLIATIPTILDEIECNCRRNQTHLNPEIHVKSCRKL